MIQLAPARAARLLVLATKMAKPQSLETLGAKEGPLHKLADSHSPKLSVAIRYAFASARSAMRPALQSREDIKKATALGIVTLRQELREVLPKALRKIYVAGGELAATNLSKGLKELEEFRTAKREPSTKINFSFDSTDENAVSWADKHAAELIDGISETSREDINNAVAEFLETGDFAELRDEILAAVGDVERADRIARNEPMVAVHEGQRAAWDQAVEAGLLPETAVREWIIVGDDKVCPICEGLEGKTAALGGEYEDGIEGPPAHVMCRCSEGLSSSFKSLGGPGSGNFGHGGRPGEVGGSSSGSSDEVDSLLNQPAILQKLNVPEVMYHVTSAANAQKILKEGLKPNQIRSSTIGQPRGVYLTPDFSGVEKEGGDIAGDTVLEIQTKDLDLRLDPEYFYYDDKSTESAEEYVAAVNDGSEAFALYAKDVIPTNSIKVREKRDLGGVGSGNFGHSGRPGQVGGSSSEGGSSKEDSRSKLHTGKLGSKKVISGSINGVHKITLRDADGDEVKAIFKPVSGESWTSGEASRNEVEAYKEEHGLDTEGVNEQLGSEFGYGDDNPVRETITNRDFTYADREAAAYELDEALGLNVVPPTIVREIDGERGMVQQFVETRGLGLRDAGIDQDSVYGLAVLDIATGNTDRHAGNVLIDTDRRVVAIDQGLSFPDDTDYHDNYQFRPDATMVLLAENQGAMSDDLSNRVAKNLANTDWEKVSAKWPMTEGERDGFLARVDRLKTVFQAPDAISRSYGVRSLISNMAKESEIHSGHSSQEVKQVNTDHLRTEISQ